MKTILENEKKRLNIAEINVYDGDGKLYLGSGNRPKSVFALYKPLDSHYLHNYSMEILIWNKLAGDTIKRTSTNFVMLLFFLMLGGAGGIYLIFRLERKNAQRLSDLERDMARQDRLVSLGRLASGMAHEIRNPLNAIGISIQRLKREFVPEDDKKEEYNSFLSIVRSELFRVNRIVENFLLSTKADMRMEPHGLRALIEEVVTMLQEKAEGAGMSMYRTKSMPASSIDCQKERMTQVFYNLIVNAIEAMAGGGAILYLRLVRQRARPPFHKGHGAGHQERRFIQDLRILLHDQGQGNGSWPAPFLHDSEGPRRRHTGIERGG